MRSGETFCCFDVTANSFYNNFCMEKGDLLSLWGSSLEGASTNFHKISRKLSITQFAHPNWQTVVSHTHTQRMAHEF